MCREAIPASTFLAWLPWKGNYCPNWVTYDPFNSRLRGWLMHIATLHGDVRQGFILSCSFQDVLFDELNKSSATLFTIKTWCFFHMCWCPLFEKNFSPHRSFEEIASRGLLILQVGSVKFVRVNESLWDVSLWPLKYFLYLLCFIGITICDLLIYIF